MGNTGRNFFIMLKILLQIDLKLLQKEYFNKKQKRNGDLIGLNGDISWGFTQELGCSEKHYGHLEVIRDDVYTILVSYVSWQLG